MTQEDKELLIKDLCARSPYKPKIKVSSVWNENKEVEEDIVDSVYCVMPDGYINTETIDSDISLDDIVLYLRPMSSMTEEEKNELNKRFYNIGYFFTQEPPYDHGLMVQHSDIGSIIVSEFSEVYDWLNAHHFDYRGLIEKGLAIEVTEENNPYI